MWNIHALIIQKKGLTKGKADKIAMDILKKKVPIRETEESWRYDFMNKNKFEKFRSHPIKEGSITLIMGELKK